MSGAIIAQNKPAGEVKKLKRFIKLETFLDRYTNRDDSFKYEWNNGFIEKKEKTMNRDQTKILQRLMRLFAKTIAYMHGGELINEVDMYMASHNRTRRADIVYMTPQQIEESDNGQITVCPFVMEVISKNDQINEVGEKMIEYFKNGVQVLWVIYPKLKKVEVYTSLENVKICYGENICSAEPVLNDFKIAVKDLIP
jgi:Uma2 family endonuclease